MMDEFDSALIGFESTGSGLGDALVSSANGDGDMISKFADAGVERFMSDIHYHHHNAATKKSEQAPAQTQHKEEKKPAKAQHEEEKKPVEKASVQKAEKPTEQKAAVKPTEQKAAVKPAEQKAAVKPTDPTDHTA